MTESASRTDPLELVKRYAILGYGAFGTMLDVGLMVLGSLLVGLSIAVLLAGFEIVNVVQELSTGAMLASALILAVIGLFCLGVASEGPLGRGRKLIGFQLWEIGIGRTVAVFLVGFAALAAYWLISGVLEDLPAPLHKGAEGLRAVGIAGMVVMPLVGVPLSLLIRWAPNAPPWLGQAEIPCLFVVWAVATMAIFV
ncbi:MAG TPA: hypothetical protein VI980_11890 [Acidimicrobiia bacterium]|nr:hypothetical protein [Acidimicrobiia bacterium]HLF61867.1 hypothetical protein [Acidimicrobiia bacterium]